MDDLTQHLIDKAWSADTLKKQKTSIKRTTTQINKIMAELRDLLTDEEKEVLKSASRCLDTWTGKAERAFKYVRDEEERKVMAREVKKTELRNKLAGDFELNEVIERVFIFTLILGRRATNNSALNLASLKDDLLESEDRKANVSFELKLSQSTKGDIYLKHDQLRRDLCSEFSWSDFEFNDFYQKFLAEYSKFKDQKNNEIKEAIELINTFRVKHRLIESNED